ncbi:hypothetical protein M8C21_017443, partial [Ambrosia artemisiifolia]
SGPRSLTIIGRRSCCNFIKQSADLVGSNGFLYKATRFLTIGFLDRRLTNHRLGASNGAKLRASRSVMVSNCDMGGGVGPLNQLESLVPQQEVAFKLLVESVPGGLLIW